MKPLEAAKALAQFDEPIEDAQYPGGPRYHAFCGGWIQDGHEPGCLWQEMPRIVAALEAGVDLAAAFIKHRTATHEVKPDYCKTCRESDVALEAWRERSGS